MSNFGGAFGIFIILVVTLAQLAGNNKRSKNKSQRRSESDGPRDDMELLRRPAESSKSKPQSKIPWNKMTKQKKIKGAKSDVAGKIAAEESAPSFEVDGHHGSDVQGFDVK